MANSTLFMTSGPQSGGTSPESNEDVDTQQPLEEGAEEVLPLPESGPNSYENWVARLEQAKKTNEDKLEKSGDANQRRYENKFRRGGDLQHTEDMLVPSTYSRIEQKKSSLIAQNPYVNVSAKHPNAVGVAPLMEAVINDVLGAPQPDGVDAWTMLRECIHDELVPGGFMACHIGYEAFIPPNAPKKTITLTPPTKPDPTWTPPVLPPGQSPMPGQQLPPQPPMVPNTAEVDNIIFERYYMDRISVRKILWSDDFHGSDYDRSPWVAFHGNIEAHKARIKWKLPDDFDVYAEMDKDLVCANDNKIHGDKLKQYHFYQIYYLTSVFDKTEVHPYKIRSLVLVDGIKEAVYHKDCDFQWENEDGTLGGMIGYPLHIGSLRAISDDAFPSSDAEMWKYQDEEISEGSTDMKLQRKGNVPGRAANLSLMKETGLGKLERGIYQAISSFPKEAFHPETGAFIGIQSIPQAPYAQENFAFADRAARQMDDAAGLGSAPGGSIPTGTASTSATQAGAADSASGSRIGLERNVFYHWYARAVQKLSVLLQHFMDTDQYVSMLDDTGAKVLQQWNKNNIQGRFTFEIEHNSSIDQAEQRNEYMQWYNLAAKDPLFNQKNLRIGLIRTFGKDPATMLAPPPPNPPPPPPALPKGVTIGLKGSDLNPLSPQSPEVLALLKDGGIAMPDAAVQAAQVQAAHTGLPVAGSGTPPPPPPPMPAGVPPGQGPGGAPPPLPIGPQVGTVPPPIEAGPTANKVDKHAHDRDNAAPLPGPGNK